MRGFISPSMPTIAEITTRLATIQASATKLTVHLNVMILGYFKPLAKLKVKILPVEATALNLLAVIQ